MTESEMVAEALIECRDNPPVRRAGTLEGRWYETGDIMGIVMAPVVEFTTHEYITRLAALMLGPTSRETEYLAHSVWAARSNDLGRRLYRAEKHAAGIEFENAKLRGLLIDAYVEFVKQYGSADDAHEYADRMRELGVEISE